MTNYIVPAVGTSGLFELRAPFDTIIIPNVNYTCKSVRSLSEMNANNEDPLATVYHPSGLTQNDYESDLAIDMRIISLQAGVGHWVHVPVSYVVKYPDTNGVPYTSKGIAIELPPLPASTDLSIVTKEIQDLLQGYLGVESRVSVVPTSYTMIVPDAQHLTTQQLRRADSVLRGTTLWQRLRSLQNQFDKLRTHCESLEKYIRDLNK